MEQELAYSFHLGCDKNKSKVAEKTAKGNVSGMILQQKMLNKSIQMNLNKLELSIIARQELVDKLKITFKKCVILKMILPVKLLQNLEIWIFGMINMRDISLKWLMYIMNK